MNKPDLDDKLDSKTSENDSDYLKETLKLENGNISVDELFIITPDILEDDDTMSKGEESSKHVFICQECGSTSKSKTLLLYHQKTVHKGVRYECGQCDYKATQKSNLTGHINSVHEGVKYFCNQCEYQATQRSSLSIHQKNIHERIMHSCNQCEYQTTLKSTLKMHQ
jgi:hypothetical protein